MKVAVLALLVPFALAACAVPPPHFSDPADNAVYNRCVSGYEALNGSPIFPSELASGCDKIVSRKAAERSAKAAKKAAEISKYGSLRAYQEHRRDEDLANIYYGCQHGAVRLPLYVSGDGVVRQQSCRQYIANLRTKIPLFLWR